MKRVFVTGIAGFVGFQLAVALKKRGDFVIGCDNFNAYYDPLLKRKRAHFLQNLGVSILECDINEKELVHRALEEHSISHFAHLAAQAGVRYAHTHPESYVHSNLNGFTAILEILRRHSGVPLVYASSSSIYGLNSKIPFAESDSTDKPASFYGATKKSNEMMAHAYNHLYKIPVTGLRFFTVYGPWGRPDMAYFSFTKSIMEGKAISVFGEGDMRRDFTYIEDIVQGVVSAIDLGADCEIFNLGNHQPHTLLELIELLEELLGKKAQKIFLPAPLTEIPTTYADISKSSARLGFQPKTSLREGLEKFIAWYRQEFV
ncbi:MAG TPA: NAD-dependent epimerase/dehydratase family protein [Rhabdochlamydiaceae bacterium]|jgi:UDP-glucuronate 4-epimerase